MILFRVTDLVVGFEAEPDLGWGKFLTGEVQIYDLPGGHPNIMEEPMVSVLPEKFNHCLYLVQASRGKVSSRYFFLLGNNFFRLHKQSISLESRYCYFVYDFPVLLEDIAVLVL